MQTKTANLVDSKQKNNVIAFPAPRVAPMQMAA